MAAVYEVTFYLSGFGLKDGNSAMDGTLRKNIKPGLLVEIIQKENQTNKKLTQGIIQEILTNSPTHRYGIKVRLVTGEVGRVKNIIR